jgi:hypothetical protein
LRHPRFSVEFVKVATFRKQIREGVLRAAQFPDTPQGRARDDHEASRLVSVAAARATLARQSHTDGSGSWRIRPESESVSTSL